MNHAEVDLLVLNSQIGSKLAFGMLFKYFYPALVGFGFKLCGNRDLANDAVQEAWIKASKNIRKLRDPRAFRSWIYKLVRWKVIDLQRKMQKETSLFENYDDQQQKLTRTQTNSDESLNKAISALPEVERQIIYLFYLDEMKMGEISIILGIPIGTVKSRLYRARKMLKQKYESMEK
jgi:RNA polymerase sigma-70 factor (ECF subfamily)